MGAYWWGPPGLGCNKEERTGKAVTMGRAAVDQREAGWAVPATGRARGGDGVGSGSAVLEHAIASAPSPAGQGPVPESK